jgi:hypothetical protein
MYYLAPYLAVRDSESVSQGLSHDLASHHHNIYHTLDTGGDSMGFLYVVRFPKKVHHPTDLLH